MRGLVLQYYLLLRSVLRAVPKRSRCLKRCRHCRIFFLTDPRNAGRKDLGCPFGCSQVHCRQQSIRRSVAYYQTEEGKEKKQRLNQRRGSVGDQAPVREAQAPPGPEPVVEHVRGVVSLIEGRPVSLEEIGEMLAKVLRQQGMGRRRKIDHAVAWLHENPP